MSGQAAHATEGLATNFTREQFRSRVNGHVILQRAVLTECAITHRAPVWSLACVNSTMRRKTARRREPAFAQFTLVSFLPAVGLHMQPQVLRTAEHFPAQRALVWFLAAVDARVSSEVSDAREPLVADRALERFLAGVAAVVYRQRGKTREALAALGAEVSHLVELSSSGPVAPVGRLSSLPLLAVGCLVPQQPALRDKCLATD